MIYIQSGFSLLEILITLMIVGILSTIVYPSYTHHIAKTNCLDAKMVVRRTAAKLEMYQAQHQTYQGATLLLVGIPQTMSDKSFQLKLSDVSSNHYTITAVATPTQANRMPNCKKIELTEKN